MQKVIMKLDCSQGTGSDALVLMSKNSYGVLKWPQVGARGWGRIRSREALAALSFSGTAGAAASLLGVSSQP